MFRSVCLSLLALAATTAQASDAAKVTQAYADVRLQPTSGAPRRALPGDTVQPGATLRTALKSRTQLRFADGTLIRAGAATQLQGGSGTRELVLREGTLFVNVPFGFFSQGSRVRCDGVDVIGNGSAFLLEHTPAREVVVNGQKKPVKGYVKAIALRGDLRVALHGRVGESTLLEPGQMIILDPNARFLPQTVDVDISRLIATTLLINPARWNGEGADLAEGIRAQAALKKDGTLIETNLSIFGRGTDVMIKPPTTPTPPSGPDVVKDRNQGPRKDPIAKPVVARPPVPY